MRRAATVSKVLLAPEHISCQPPYPQFRPKKQVRDLPEGLRPAFNQPLDLPEGPSPGPRPDDPAPGTWGCLVATRLPHLPEGRQPRLRPGDPPPGRSTTSARRRSRSSRKLSHSVRTTSAEPESPPQPSSSFFASPPLVSAPATGADRCPAAAASRWFTIGSSARRAASAVFGSSCSTDPTTLLA